MIRSDILLNDVVHPNILLDEDDADDAFDTIRHLYKSKDPNDIQSRKSAEDKGDRDAGYPHENAVE